MRSGATAVDMLLSLKTCLRWWAEGICDPTLACCDSRSVWKLNLLKPPQLNDFASQKMMSVGLGDLKSNVGMLRFKVTLEL